MSAPVVIVSGLARCGTSMVMQMLQAGGVHCAGEYPAFEPPESDPSRVNRTWLRDHAGGAVKVLDPHRVNGGFYALRCAVIWMDRNVTEQARSQVKFCNAMFPGLAPGRAAWRAVRSCLIRERRIALEAAGYGMHPWLALRFEDVLDKPLATSKRLQSFLADIEIGFDPLTAWRVVRNRPAACFDGLLELELMQNLKVGS